MAIHNNKIKIKKCCRCYRKFNY